MFSFKYQVDVNIVAYSIIILLYSQWKTATSLIQPDESDEKSPFPESGWLPQSIKELFYMSVANKDLRLENTAEPQFLDVIPEFPDSSQTLQVEVGGEHQPVWAMQVTCEMFFFIIMSLVSLRFRRNFINSHKYSTILRNTNWSEEEGQELSARALHAQQTFYSRIAPYEFLWNYNQINEVN